MSLQFDKTISGDKYSFIIESGLRNRIRKANRKNNIVFVEGYDDEVIYNIVYEKEELCNILFIDVSLANKKTGGCEEVKRLLTGCVQKLPNQKCFYGVIDRDLKTDQEVKEETLKPEYDGRLFIFFERYTLENYFIETRILYNFLKGQSIHYTKLKDYLDKGEEIFEIELINPILTDLASIAAANLTIRFFDFSEKFLEDTVSCKEGTIETRVVQRLNQTSISEEEILSKFSDFKQKRIEKKDTQKFASAKTYFSCQFNRRLKKQAKVNIQLNNQKYELASILKENGLSKDFQDLVSLISQCQ